MSPHIARIATTGLEARRLELVQKEIGGQLTPLLVAELVAVQAELARRKSGAGVVKR